MQSKYDTMVNLPTATNNEIATNISNKNIVNKLSENKKAFFSHPAPSLQMDA